MYKGQWEMGNGISGWMGGTACCKRERSRAEVGSICKQRTAYPAMVLAMGHGMQAQSGLWRRGV